jgi:hypothetical protein
MMMIPLKLAFIFSLTLSPLIASDYFQDPFNETKDYQISHKRKKNRSPLKTRAMKTRFSPIDQYIDSKDLLIQTASYLSPSEITSFSLAMGKQRYQNLQGILKHLHFTADMNSVLAPMKTTLPHVSFITSPRSVDIFLDHLCLEDAPYFFSSLLEGHKKAYITPNETALFLQKTVQRRNLLTKIQNFTDPFFQKEIIAPLGLNFILDTIVSGEKKFCFIDELPENPLQKGNLRNIGFRHIAQNKQENIDYRLLAIENLIDEEKNPFFETAVSLLEEMNNRDDLSPSHQLTIQKLFIHLDQHHLHDINFCKSMLLDPNLNIRMQACYALGQFNEPFPETILTLENIANNTQPLPQEILEGRTHAYHRINAAQELIRFGIPYSDSGFGALLSIIDDQNMNHEDKLSAIEILIEKQQYLHKAKKALCSMIQEKSVMPRMKLEMGKLLWGISEKYKKIIAKIYYTIARNSSLDVLMRITAADYLHDLGGKRYQLKIQEAYKKIAQNPGENVWNIRYIQKILDKYNSNFPPESVCILESIARYPNTNDQIQIKAIGRFMEIDPTSIQEMIPILEFLALHSNNKILALETLIPYKEDVKNTLEAIIDDGESKKTQIIEALSILIEHTEFDAQKAIEILENRILSSRHFLDRLKGAQILMSLENYDQQRIIPILDHLITNAQNPNIILESCKILISFQEPHHSKATQALLNLTKQNIPITQAPWKKEALKILVSLK